MDALVIIVSSILGGLLGVVISNNHYKKQQLKKLKISLLTDIIGYRYQNGGSEGKDFICALNKNTYCI